MSVCRYYGMCETAWEIGCDGSKDTACSYFEPMPDAGRMKGDGEEAEDGVEVGRVRPFPELDADKAQALKPLEEAAEAFGAWQRWVETRSGRDRYRWADDPEPLKNLLDEMADVIQACVNLAAALGVDDMRPYMEACEKRNRERGRYGGR